LENLDVDGKTKWLVEKYVQMAWTEVVWLRMGTNGGLM
jgi:hypothetical protein